MTISLDKTALTTITRPNFTFSQETITASTDTAEEDEDFVENKIDVYWDEADGREE